jgi:hypothetical protein
MATEIHRVLINFEVLQKDFTCLAEGKHLVNNGIPSNDLIQLKYLNLFISFSSSNE